MRSLSFPLLLVVASLLLAGCNGGEHRSGTNGAMSRLAASPELERVEPLRVEAIEAGEVHLAEASGAELEATLRDLNRRKDYDAAQHGGQPGPDAAYLAAWVDRVTRELLARGYGIDGEGRLRRPGAVVPWR